MAPTIENTKQLIRNASMRTFTLQEACEFMEVLDNMPTGTDYNIQWVDVKTKEPIAIGYNH